MSPQPGLRPAARLAGWAYLISVAMVVYANFGIRSRFLDSGDLAASLQRVSGAALVFRASVALDLAYAAGVIVVGMALYVLLRDGNRLVALVALGWRMAYAATAILYAMSFLNIARLAPAGGAFASVPLEQRAVLALVELSSAWNEYYVGLALWSCSAVAYYWLWLRTQRAPRGLAAFGILASAWCAFCAVAYLVAPGFSRTVNLWLFDLPMVGCDIVLSIWLITKGPASGTVEASTQAA